MSSQNSKDRIIIIDFGSQVTKLIARRVRDFGVFSLVLPYNSLNQKIFTNNEIEGLIFSGGPRSVGEKNSPRLPKFIYEKEIPILGICYGLQLICKQFGGKLKSSEDREFGKQKIIIQKTSPFLKNSYSLKGKYQVWMSHSDSVERLPKGFETIASSGVCRNAIIQNIKKRIFGVQFHPEVVHTSRGTDLLKRKHKDLFLIRLHSHYLKILKIF